MVNRSSMKGYKGWCNSREFCLGEIGVLPLGKRGGTVIHVGGLISLAAIALFVVLVCLPIFLPYVWQPPQVVSYQLGAPNMDLRVSPNHPPGLNWEVSPRYIWRMPWTFGECAVYFYEEP
jgi:hypothetical protein